MNVLMVVCGDAEVSAAGASGKPVEQLRLPSRPDKAAVDPVLERLGDGRLVVAGTDADLAAVVLRLLRTERLGGVQVGFVPTDPGSAAAAIYGLPATAEPGAPDTPAGSGLAAAVDLALTGDVDPVPLVRDDAGGVLVGLGLLRRVRGVAYCDDDRILRGLAARLEVTPDPTATANTASGGLVVRVWSGSLFRRRTRGAEGRAMQLGCVPANVEHDGITTELPVKRWTWYRHTEDLRLVRGLR